MGQCNAKTKDGDPCQIPTQERKKYCHVHSRKYSWRWKIGIGTFALALFGFIANLTGVLGYFDIYPFGLRPTATVVKTETPTPISITSTPSIDTPSIYIADWVGPHSTLSKKLLVNQLSCTSEQGFEQLLFVDNGPFSVPLGNTQTLRYYVILETWISLTFVNSNDIPDGIIRIEPIYNTDYERQWQLNAWYITMYHPDDLKKAIVPPVELPSNTPVKRYFRAIHVVDVSPDILAGAVYKYADEALSPLRWTFTALGDRQIIHTSELQQYASEAMDDGKFKFKYNCIDILPEWPVPIPGRALSGN